MHLVSKESPLKIRSMSIALLEPVDSPSLSLLDIKHFNARFLAASLAVALLESDEAATVALGFDE